MMVHVDDSYPRRGPGTFATGTFAHMGRWSSWSHVPGWCMHTHTHTHTCSNAGCARGLLDDVDDDCVTNTR